MAITSTRRYETTIKDLVNTCHRYWDGNLPVQVQDITKQIGINIEFITETTNINNDTIYVIEQIVKDPYYGRQELAYKLGEFLLCKQFPLVDQHTKNIVLPLFIRDLIVPKNKVIEETINNVRNNSTNSNLFDKTWKFSINRYSKKELKDLFVHYTDKCDINDLQRIFMVPKDILIAQINDLKK